MLMIGRDDDVTVSAKAHGVTPETVCSIGAAAELLSRGAYDVVLITSGICENISGDDISRLRGASEKPVKIAGICSDTLAQRFQETLDCAKTGLPMKMKKRRQNPARRSAGCGSCVPKITR